MSYAIQSLSGDTFDSLQSQAEAGLSPPFMVEAYPEKGISLVDPKSILVLRMLLNPSRKPKPIEVVKMVELFGKTITDPSSIGAGGDTLGLVYSGSSQPGVSLVDLIVRVPDQTAPSRPPVRPAYDIMKGARRHPEWAQSLSDFWPLLSVWREIKDPVEKAYWLQQPPLWNHAAEGAGETWGENSILTGPEFKAVGSPTKALSEKRNLWWGPLIKREELIVEPQVTPPPLPIPDGGDGPGGGSGPGPGPDGGSGSSGYAVAVVAGAALIGLAIYAWGEP